MGTSLVHSVVQMPPNFQEKKEPVFFVPISVMNSNIEKGTKNELFSNVMKIVRVSLILMGGIAIYGFAYDLGFGNGYIKGKFAGWMSGVDHGAEFKENVCEIRRLNELITDQLR